LLLILFNRQEVRMNVVGSGTKRVILLSKVSTYRARPFLAAAKRLGIKVVQGIDMDPALVEHWHVSLGLQFDKPQEAAQKIVAFAREKPVQAVISIDDSASEIAAMASEALGLPHNSSKSALAARDKYEMRKLLSQAGVPCPEFTLYDIAADPDQIAATVKYPAVIKPLVLSGSRGVIRVNDPLEFREAFLRVKRMLSALEQAPGTNNILVETYIPGIEVALEGILNRGNFKVLALFDKPDPLEGPFFEETIYVTPSRLPERVQTAIADCTAQAVAALGLRHGPIHAELRVNDAGPWILEVAGRSIGGLCSETLQFGSDISLEELILRQAIGLEIEAYSRENRARGVMMIPIPEAGILKGIEGIEEAKQAPLIDGIDITAQINYPLVPLPEGDSYLGFIFASGQKPDEVEAALRQAHQKLHFQVEPMLPLLP
jgi:biotin carboxylase